MFSNQSLFNLFHVLKNGLRTCDLCGSCAVVYQLLVILLPATGIWGFPVVTVHVKFITPMIFYLPYISKADIFSHTWRWVIVCKVRQVLKDLTRIFTMLLLKVWSFCQVVFLIRRENVCTESLCAHVQLFLQHRRFHCHFAWFPWFPDNLIPNCIANFKTNFRQREHKQHRKNWKRFDRRFVLRGPIINHKFLRCFISSSQIMIASYPWSLGNDSWSSILGKCPAPIMHYASIIVFGS